jgi:hypothetical protein
MQISYIEFLTRQCRGSSVAKSEANFDERSGIYCNQTQINYNVMPTCPRKIFTCDA